TRASPQARQFASMRLSRTPLLWQLPKPHGRVIAPGQCPPTVRGKGHPKDQIRVSGKTTEFLARLDIPQPYGPALPARQRPPPIPRKSHVNHEILVGEAPQFLARLHVP